MKVVSDHQGFQQQYSRCVATIGKFDGVHLGHQAILKQLRAWAQELGLPAMVILIEPHPEEFFAADSQQCPARLTILEEKLRLIEAMGIDYVYILNFDHALSSQSASVYIENILVDGLGIAALIVGSDFRFGNRRQGDFKLLQDYGRQYDFVVQETPSCEVDGRRVSSTLVREQLESGDFEAVNRLLGRKFSISGRVIKGENKGKELGFPTCNIKLQRRRIPLHGVFACVVILDDCDIPAAVNIGFRPTVTEAGEALLEAHLLDFDADLYDQQLEVVFKVKIREEQKFDGIDALKAQVATDVQAVRAYFSQ